MKRKVMSLLIAVFFVTTLFTACGSTTEKTTEAVQSESQADSSVQTEVTEVKNENLEKSLAIDISGLKSSDNQPLLLPMEAKEIPPRPEDPSKLPEEDALHWYDMEYLGWNIQKENIPVSPKDGAIGKKVICIINGEHPYLTAYGNGMKKLAAAYNIDVKIQSPNWDVNVQNQMVEQAINAKPDMLILLPDDAKAAVQQFRKINQAGIPVIGSNMLPEADAIKYMIAWTGPDDWGQFRMLAKTFAEKMNYEGGYCIIQHAPGGSPFFSRTYGIVTELKKIAPKMKLLAVQAPGFEAEKSMKVASDWITKYGSELKGMVASDDSTQMIGIIEACKKANRNDIIKVAAGNSKAGMDAIKAGDLTAISYQSAEADGAQALKAAIDWFNGKDVSPVLYIPKHIITKDDVDMFMPAQW